jgi:hypothetical protein
MKPGSGDVLTLLNEERDKYLIYLDGEMMNHVIYAECGENGFLVHYVMTPDGQHMTDGATGGLLKRKRWGKVEFIENPTYVKEKSIFTPP